MPTVPTPPPLETDAARGHGFQDTAELQAIEALVAAFCGAPVALVLGDAQGVWYGCHPAALRELARGRAPGASWTWAGAEGIGRWVLDGQGQAAGLLWVTGPLAPAARDGVGQAASLAAAAVVRAEALRDRRGAGSGRGPAAASFVPGLVHELRNASFGFSATLDAFQARFGAGEEARSHGGALRRSLKRLTGFIDELGAFGEPASGPRMDVPLDLVLGEAVAESRLRAEGLGMALALEQEGPRAVVRADRDALCEAFASLLKWALGQGQGGSRVTLRARRREGEARVLGELEGPGLLDGPVDLARVFEPFYFRAAGLGRLALPVARRTLEAHGGTLRAGPGPEGGVMLAFSLPCR